LKQIKDEASQGIPYHRGDDRNDGVDPIKARDADLGVSEIEDIGDRVVAAKKHHRRDRKADHDELGGVAFDALEAFDGQIDEGARSKGTKDAAIPSRPFTIKEFGGKRDGPIGEDDAGKIANKHGADDVADSHDSYVDRVVFVVFKKITDFSGEKIRAQNADAHEAKGEKHRAEDGLAHRGKLKIHGASDADQHSG